MSYELTLALNLKTKAVTQYMNYEFNSVASYADNEFGASDSGIKILDGENPTDGGDTINWSAGVGFHDFGSMYKKRLRRVFANMQSDGAVVVTIDTENGDKQSYRLTSDTITNNTPTPHVSFIGRTHKGRQYKLLLENNGRAFATIESIDAIFHTLNTRVTGR